MDLFVMELAGLAGLHQLDCFVERRRPVEPATECIADEGSGRRVVPAVSALYVS